MAKSTRSKGDGSIYQRADGRWIASIETGYTTSGRKRRTVSAKTRREVVAKLRKIQGEQAQGIHTGETTLAAWLDHWLDEIQMHRVKQVTLYNQRRQIERYHKPILGRVKLAALTPAHVRKLHSELASRGLSPTTIRQAHATLARALKVAEREGLVARNVANLVDVPAPSANHHAALSAEQARTVLQWAADRDDARLLARLTCALVLGLRRGEALGLRWDDIDLEAGDMSIHIGLNRVPGVGLLETGVKSAASQRVIPIPAGVVAILAAWRARNPDAYVFPASAGGPETDLRLDWQRWADALAAAGVPHVPMHGARATSATLLRAMGVPERTIADILGHSQVRVTMEHYLRSDETQRRAALEASAGQLLTRTSSAT